MLLCTEAQRHVFWVFATTRQGSYIYNFLTKLILHVFQTLVRLFNMFHLCIIKVLLYKKRQCRFVVFGFKNNVYTEGGKDSSSL